MSGENPFAGIYSGALVDWGTEEPQGKSPFVRLEFEVRFRDAGKTPDGKTKWEKLAEPLKRFVRLYLSDKAFPYTAEKLNSLGFNGDYASETMDFGDKAKKHTPLELRYETYEGEAREKWNLAGGGGIEKVPASASLVQQLNMKHRALSAPAAGKQADLTPPDADIPF